MKSILSLTFNMLVGVALFAQASPQAVLSPFPAWPPDGNIPDSLKDHYVFLGPRLGQVTVSYPASLDGDPSLTGRKMFTLELPNQVEPIFSVQISQDANGRFNYDYVLRNGESAKQMIRTWSFVGPANDPEFRAQCTGWSANKARAQTARSRQLELPNTTQAGVEVNFFSHPGNEIKPGRSLGGFQITSGYLPGFTTAFVRSSGGFQFPEELPTPVADQVGILDRPEWSSRLALVLGPRFPKEWSKQAVAADFHYGISRLVRNGKLSGDSPFISQALPTLAKAIESADTATLADQLSSLPKAVPGLESEIATAMQVSLK